MFYGTYIPLQGIDVIVATSKHNVAYLLGGHRAHFFDYMDAVGISRYLPVLVYAKGQPEKAGYFGHRLETFQLQAKPVWTPETKTNVNNSPDAINQAIDFLTHVGYNGPGSAVTFNATYTRAGAIALKTALDNYNNGLGCP